MLPYFFERADFNINQQFILSNETSKHCTVVLRMQVGEQLILVNGNGSKATATIIVVNKSKTVVNINSVETQPSRSNKIVLAVGLTKNRSRNEWLFEKAVEIGVDVIIPLQCANSERDKLNPERLESIMIAAMMQSQQLFLPQLTELLSPAKAIDYVRNNIKDVAMFLAHCEEGNKNVLSNNNIHNSVAIFIGPEGDFNPKEIDYALNHNVTPIALGSNRLRTETAAIYALTMCNAILYPM